MAFCLEEVIVTIPVEAGRVVQIKGVVVVDRAEVEAIKEIIHVVAVVI